VVRSSVSPALSSSSIFSWTAYAPPLATTTNHTPPPRNIMLPFLVSVALLPLFVFAQLEGSEPSTVRPISVSTIATVATEGSIPTAYYSSVTAQHPSATAVPTPIPHRSSKSLTIVLSVVFSIIGALVLLCIALVISRLYNKKKLAARRRTRSPWMLRISQWGPETKQRDDSHSITDLHPRSVSDKV